MGYRLHPTKNRTPRPDGKLEWIIDTTVRCVFYGRTLGLWGDTAKAREMLDEEFPGWDDDIKEISDMAKKAKSDYMLRKAA